MDIGGLLYGNSYGSWEQRKIFTIIFGAVMLLVTYLLERNVKMREYLFWGYLFGLAAFWGGLSMLNSGSELGKFLYFLINIGLVVVSLILKRITFIVFGALGVWGYLVYLAHSVFADSFAFPFVLCAIGISIIYSGVQYSKHRLVLEIYVGRLVYHSTNSTRIVVYVDGYWRVIVWK